MAKAGAIALAALLIAIPIIQGCSEKKDYSAFAQCLTDAGVTMYGTDWCPKCKEQKAMFGKAFGLINYVNCDKDMDRCLREGVPGYPMWEINGKDYRGVQRLEKIGILAGCNLDGSVVE